jgi:hypothetical protein
MDLNSMMISASQDSGAVNSLNKTTTPMSNTGTKSRIAPKFRGLSFRTTVKADLLNAVDKGLGALLQEHISNCMALERPLYVTLQIAFYDASRLSGEPDIESYY